MTDEEPDVLMVEHENIIKALYGPMGAFDILEKAHLGEGESNVDKETVQTGLISWPFDPVEVNNFRHSNNMHSRAIEAKVAATVGLGFVVPEVEEQLDPLCDDDDVISVLSDVCDDFYGVGNGWLEVVRPDEQLAGLHHTMSPCVHIERESATDYHYVVRAEYGQDVHMARWGEKERLSQVLKSSATKEDTNSISELIHFAQVPSAWDRWYGVPSWLSAIPMIKTVQEVHQFNFDFFKNRAVPELLLLMLGASVNKTDMNAIKAHFRSVRGGGNHGKTLALNLPHESIKVQLEKLSEGKMEGGFLELMDRYDLGVLAAHGVTPVLVGIQTSAKILGQTKEVRDNLQLLQALTIKPNQRIFRKRLEATLGKVVKNIPKKTRVKQEVSGVTQEMVTEKESGWNFNKITDEIEFDMTPQVGGPNAAGQNSEQGKKPSKSNSSKDS